MDRFLEASSERSWADLQDLSDEDLIALHDALSNTTGLKPDYYRDELRYRRQLDLARRQTNLAQEMQSLTRVMLRLTVVIAFLTLVVTVATIYNAIF